MPLAGGSLGGAIQESEPGLSNVGWAHVPERAVGFVGVSLEPASGEAAFAESDAADLGEDSGVVVLAPVVEEPGDAALRRAAPDDGAVLAPAVEGLGAAPITGGIPNPAGETGLPGAEGDGDPVAAAVPGEDAEDAPPRADTAGAPAGDALGRGVDTCDAVPDDVGADVPLPAAESVSTGPSGSNN